MNWGPTRIDHAFRDIALLQSQVKSLQRQLETLNEIKADRKAEKMPIRVVDSSNKQMYRITNKYNHEVKLPQSENVEIRKLLNLLAEDLGLMLVYRKNGDTHKPEVICLDDYSKGEEE